MNTHMMKEASNTATVSDTNDSNFAEPSDSEICLDLKLHQHDANNSNSNKIAKVSSSISKYSAPHRKLNVNYIMLFTTIMVRFLSICLHVMDLFLGWLLPQIIKRRNKFMGNLNIWTFLNVDDNQIIEVRSKLFMLPFLLACNILYGFMYILQFSIQLVLTSVSDETFETIMIII